MADSTPALRQRVETAINDHLTASGGGMLISFYLIASVIDADGSHGWINTCPDGQPVMVTMGLLEFAQGLTRHDLERHLDDGDG